MLRRKWLAGILLSATVAGCAGGGEPTDTITGDEGCAPLDVVPRRLWRLSVQQYSNSMRDLLGLATAPDLGTLGGQSTYAFFADETLTVDPQLAYNANTTLREALDGLDMRQLAACKSGEADSACASRFATEFGRRAFRRPLDAGEVAGLMKVYNAGQAESFNAGISLMVQALLQAPSFLFRSELGPARSAGAPVTQLDPYEVATQLAYTFLDSTPDQGLMAAAANGSLGTPAGVTKEVDRLLQLPAVRSNINRITLSWFNVEQLYAKQKDRSLLVALGPTDDTLADMTTALQNDMMTSTNMFVDSVYWSGSGKVADLLTADTLFVNERLGTLLTLPFDGAQPEHFVGIPGTDQKRAGMLTQPGFLWAVSDVATTSIVHRGIGVHNNIICADPITFPSGLINSPDIVAALAARPTEIQKSNYRLHENPVCTGCHGNIDPYGRVLEGFDAVGAVRTVADGLPVDQTADFSGAPPLSGVMNGPVELAHAILANDQFVGCAAQMLSSYVIGRMIHANATCEVQVVRKKLLMADGKISTLLSDIAAAAFVRARAGGAQ